VLDERALKRGGFGAILAVGAGSATPPRLVRLSYKPARAKAKVALVGKGITFDSGGLDLKQANMAQMKSDMGGAAAVISAIIAALGGPKLPNLCDSEYSTLFVVRVTGSPSPVVVRQHYGAPDPVPDASCLAMGK